MPIRRSAVEPEAVVSSSPENVAPSTPGLIQEDPETAPGLWETQAQVLEKIRPKMQGILRHYRIPPEDAEDVLQDIYLLLVYKWETLRSPENWLIGATKNRCIMYWRRRRRMQSRTAEVESLEHFSEPPPQKTAELHLDVNRAFARLPERCRTVLRLRYGLGYEPKEVADRLGYSRLSIGKVTNRCFKALVGAMEEPREVEGGEEAEAGGETVGAASPPARAEALAGAGRSSGRP
jgi:RNA polymerase sigma factor (sigma-70 family)